MNIYLGHSTQSDFALELYAPIKESSLYKEHTFILPHEHSLDATKFVTRDILKTCDLMIAEVSYPSTGLGIELGWADTYKCPIVCICRKGIKVSSALKVVSDVFIEYADEEELIRQLEKVLHNLN